MPDLAPPRADRPYDVVVFGATSFVGQILCRYLVERHGIDGSLRWAIAGRSADKLATVAAETGATVDAVVVDASDPEGLAAMVRSTRVVVSTVGPYARYGSPLVAAAAVAGTDYADLTGETQWMRRMIDAHHDDAVASGARIVRVRVRLHPIGPRGVVHPAASDRAARRALHPDRHAGPGHEGRRERRHHRLHAQRARRGRGRPEPAEAPRRSLRPRSPGPPLRTPAARGPPADARRSERPVAGTVRDGGGEHPGRPSQPRAARPTVGSGVPVPGGDGDGVRPLGAVKAGGLTAGLGVGMGLGTLGPARTLAAKVVPAPGTGPSPEAQRDGFFDLRFTGTTDAGDAIETQVTGDRDPGYGSTAKMLGEAATTLLDLPADEIGGGFWTPASALGDRLVERLEAHAGLRFAVRT